MTRKIEWTTDPIADMLTRDSQCLEGQAPPCGCAQLQAQSGIRAILKDEGYLTIEVVDENKVKRRCASRYATPADKRSVITHLKRISRPGCRRYVGKTGIRPVVGGMGISYCRRPGG